MDSDARADELVGRGMRDGSQLFREWFGELTSAPESQGQAAYVFVMGSLAELLRVFDFPLVFPEINSLQTAVRRAAAGYLSQAEDYGYSPDICGYVKADVAVQLRGGEHPLGGHPPPAPAGGANARNHHIKRGGGWGG